MPILTNLRLDPFERTGWSGDGVAKGSVQCWDWFKFEFWRFVFVQQVLGKEIQTFLDFPAMQSGASFNLDALKAELQERMTEARAAAKGAGDRVYDAAASGLDPQAAILTRNSRH
jgi:arylsulfatase